MGKEQKGAIIAIPAGFAKGQVLTALHACMGALKTSSGPLPIPEIVPCRQGTTEGGSPCEMGIPIMQTPLFCSVRQKGVY